MRLCLISHVSFTKAEEVHYCTPGFAKLVEMFAPLYDEVELCVPVFDDPVPKNNAAVRIRNLKFCPLPPYFSGRKISGWEAAALKHPLKLMRCLWPYVKRADTVLISLPNYLSILAWWVCLLQRKQFAIRIAGNWPEIIRLGFQNRGMSKLGNVVAFVHKLMLKRIVSTSALTLAHGKELAGIYGRNNSQVVRVVSSTFHNTDIASTIAGSSSDECRILYVGRLQFSKGLSELFQAARDLLVEGLKFRILLAGDGPRRNEITKEAEELGIIDRVEFLGWIAIEKLKDIYRACDIFVLPSYSEGMPKVLTEAMSNGLPTVATNVGGIPSIVQDGVTGLVVPIKDTEALQDALRKLILDEPLRHRMAEAGLKRSYQFTMEAERTCVKAALQKFGLFSHAIEAQETKQ